MTTTADPTRRFLEARKIVLVVAIGLLALGLRLYQLGHENLWIDEVYTHQVASQELVDIVRNYRPSSPAGTHDQAPAWFAIDHFFVTDRAPEFYLRLPAAVLGTAEVLVLYALARQLLPTLPSLLAAFLLAVSPLHVWYSQEARWYALWSLVTTLSYLALVKAQRTNRAGPWIGFAATVLLNLYTFVFSVFVLAAQAVSLFWRRLNRLPPPRSLMVFAAVVVTCVIAATPVMLVALHYAPDARTGSGRPSSLLELPYTGLAYGVGFSLGPSLAELHDVPDAIGMVLEYPSLLLAAIIFLPIVGLGLRSTLLTPRLATWLIPWLVIPSVSIFLLSMATGITYQVRYGFASLPAFALIVALGLTSMTGTWRVLGFVALMGLSVFSLANYFWNPKFDRADTRGALALVHASGGASMQLTVVGQIGLAVPFYTRDSDAWQITSCGAVNYGGYADFGPCGDQRDSAPLPSDFDLDRELWMISGRDWERSTDCCLETLRRTHAVTDSHMLPGVKIWRLGPRSQSTQPR